MKARLYVPASVTNPAPAADRLVSEIELPPGVVPGIVAFGQRLFVRSLQADECAQQGAHSYVEAMVFVVPVVAKCGTVAVLPCSCGGGLFVEFLLGEQGWFLRCQTCRGVSHPSQPTRDAAAHTWNATRAMR